jgi:hypothetical protein
VHLEIYMLRRRQAWLDEQIREQSRSRAADKDQLRALWRRKGEIQRQIAALRDRQTQIVQEAAP